MNISEHLMRILIKGNEQFVYFRSSKETRNVIRSQKEFLEYSRWSQESLGEREEPTFSWSRVDASSAIEWEVVDGRSDQWLSLWLRGIYSQPLRNIRT